MMDSKLLSLSWDAYKNAVCNGLTLLQQQGEFVDMTLAADGHHVKVHQMVMSLVSPFIKELIISTDCPHPVIFLNKVQHGTLQSILEYAYTGEVMVAPENLSSFLEACKELHIKGLEDLTIHGDGKDLLHVIDVIDPEESIDISETLVQSFKTGIKRKRSSKVKTEEEEAQDNGYSHNNELECHYVEIDPYKAGSRWFWRNDYFYVVNRTKGPTTYLRCASDKCPAHWNLSKKKGAGPVIGVHNHEPTPWIQNRNAMFTELRKRTMSENLPYNVIYAQEAIRFNDAVKHMPFESVLPSMRKWRKSKQQANLRALQSMG